LYKGPVDIFNQSNGEEDSGEWVHVNSVQRLPPRRSEGQRNLRIETTSICARPVVNSFKICARSSGSLAAQKRVCFLEFLLNKLEVLVLQYFGTGPTL
jgi:hypothetical protein